MAYWFWEAIEKGTDLFPYRVGAFHCYAPARRRAHSLNAAVVRRFESDAVIHSDIEVLDRAGKVYYRLDNWETRRFPQPPRFLRLRIDPRANCISQRRGKSRYALRRANREWRAAAWRICRRRSWNRRIACG